MVMGMEELIYSEISEDNIEMATSEIDVMNETLSFIADNPININTSTRSQLENLPFLKNSQIENLMEYLFDYGPMESIYELALVEGFDTNTIREILPFVKVSRIDSKHKFSFKNLTESGSPSLPYLATTPGQ